ncbi:MAG: site-specific DNA-methyltransferase [Nitrospirae bacterium]|nr:site-specific DNA-methyltransferase [Nitrospirota bacterium]MCX7020642.1 site-specific DNA-methyltransferase [Candidatus Sumerlaeota bacterium]
MTEKSDKKTKSGKVDLTDNEFRDLEQAAHRRGFPDVKEYLLALHHESSPKTAADSSGLEIAGVPLPILAHKTKLGRIYCGDSAALLGRKDPVGDDSVDLIMTSPPFGLLRPKDYGNEDADRYVAWFERFGAQFHRILKPSGSLVIDIGGAWKRGIPTRSLYHYELLIMLCRKFEFHLAQEFFWWNPAKLPTPAEWVNIRRVRVKDAVNCIWWLSKTPFPKASNRRVLQPYSPSMQNLLKHGYKAKLRPSGHDISDKFQRDNGGAIPPNLIALANTESNTAYQRYCREHDLPEHPARFPSGVPAFFVNMLTDKGDLVVDPFAGSCMTGYVTEQMGRRWLCCELDQQYVEGAKARFIGDGCLFADTGSTREAPYEIYAPRLPIGSEDGLPLAMDGGKTRPK